MDKIKMGFNNFQNYLNKKSASYILLMFQVFSLVTTIEGAKIVLSSLKSNFLFGIEIQAYVVLGVGIQLLLLWLFTIGKNQIKSPLRVWTLMLIYTFFSIYTSFFSFYQGIFGVNLTQNNNNNAIESHNTLKSLIYDPQVRELIDIEQKILDAEKNLQQDFDNSNGKGVREESNRLKNLREEQRQLSKKYGYTKEEDFESLFKTRDKLESKPAGEIYTKNKNAIITLPNDIYEELKEKLKKKGLDKENFSNDNAKAKYIEKNSQFLVPFIEVRRGNPQAILALILASVVDVTSLILGSIIKKDDDNKNLTKKLGAQILLISSTVSKVLKELLPHLMEEIGHLIFTISRSLGSILHGIFFGIISAKKRSLQIFYYNGDSIKIKGSRQDFFLLLWNNIEFFVENSKDDKEDVAIINYKKLISSVQNNNETFKNGYKKILFQMLSLKWLEKEIQNNEIFFVIKDYDKFTNWSQQEESKQFEKEKHSMLLPNDYYTLIRLPKKEGFVKKTGIKFKFWLQQVF